MITYRLAAVVVIAASAVGGLAAASRAKPYASIDRCLNSNGAWDYRGNRCQAVPVGPVDYVLIDKSDRWLATYRGGELIREFRVALGSGGVAPKTQQGDKRVPEGTYRITFHNPASGYHRSLKIGYPTTEQLAAARQAGIDPGDDIMIHGLPNGLSRIGSRHLLRDWTRGCIAVTNQEIEWLFAVVPDGTPVHIRA